MTTTWNKVLFCSNCITFWFFFFVLFFPSCATTTNLFFNTCFVVMVFSVETMRVLKIHKPHHHNDEASYIHLSTLLWSWARSNINNWNMLFITQLFHLQYFKKHHEYKSTKWNFCTWEPFGNEMYYQNQSKWRKDGLKNGLKEERWIAKEKKLMITPISILSWVVLFFMSRIDANLNSSQSINGNSPKWQQLKKPQGTP